MNDDTSRDSIEQDVPSDREQHGRDSHSADASGLLANRGMPALGQFGGSRPRAWWLTPVVIFVVVGAGAVWTVHGFYARHAAEAKAHRDSMSDTSTQGRMFRGQPASVPDAGVSVPAVAGDIVAGPVQASATVADHSRHDTVRHAAVRSYFDAPLLAAGSAGNQEAGADPSGFASSMSANVSKGTVASGRKTDQAGGALADALTPTVMPRVNAGTLGDRSLVLAQGAKIDCAGDTAFDSTEAGISTCTVTKNVYSDDGRVVLIERGSQINSQYRSNLSPGQKRVFVLSARVKTPNGVTVEIDSPAADALGRMGTNGFIDNHWSQRVGAALMLGISQDAIGYMATRGGNGGGSVVFENTQQQGNDMGTRVLDSTINIPPTLTQNQGAEFTIVIARDLDFGAVYMLKPETTP